MYEHPKVEFYAMKTCAEYKRWVLYFVGDAFGRGKKLKNYFRMWSLGATINSVTRIFSQGYDEDDFDEYIEYDDQQFVDGQSPSMSPSSTISPSQGDRRESVESREANIYEFNILRSQTQAYKEKLHSFTEIAIDGNSMYISRQLVFGWKRYVDNLNAKRSRAKTIGRQRPKHFMALIIFKWASTTLETARQKSIARGQVLKFESKCMMTCFVCWTCLPAITRMHNNWMQSLQGAQAELDRVRSDWEGVVAGLEAALAAEVGKPSDASGHLPAR